VRNNLFIAADDGTAGADIAKKFQTALNDNSIPIMKPENTKDWNEELIFKNQPDTDEKTKDIDKPKGLSI
jgi:hypothetical protein